MTEQPLSSSPADTARLFALIPCAGSGSRAGTAQPKQYQVIAGAPMVLHTLAAFAGVARLTECLVVVAPGDAGRPVAMTSRPSSAGGMAPA